MAEESRLLNLICTLSRILPDVHRANNLIPFCQKAIYTVISLLIFLVGSQLPLYGVQPATDQVDSLNWPCLLWASKHDTLMMLGITPILVPEVMIQFMVLLQIITRVNTPEAHLVLNRLRKFLGILFAIMIATIYVFCKPGTGNTVLIMLQIVLSGIVVIYLDDFLKKGYGLLPCIPLFTAANICEIVLWKAFSPCYFIYHEQGTQYEGAIIALIHLLITREDKLSAMYEALFRRNLPNVTDLLATYVFFKIAMIFHGIYILLPTRRPGLPPQVNYNVKLSDISYTPAVLHRTLILLLYIYPKLLLKRCVENKGVDLLINWKRSGHFGRFVPVGGILYNVPTPVIMDDLWAHPVHAFLYATLVLNTCTVLTEASFLASLHSVRFLTGLYRGNVWEEGHVHAALIDVMPDKDVYRELVVAARFGGFCVGALIIFGDIFGVIGCGTSIMLAVSAVYPYFDGRPVDVGVFGL